MHFGANEKDPYDPRLIEDHLQEIRTCHKLSRGCFFLVELSQRLNWLFWPSWLFQCLVGSKYDPYYLPLRIEADKFLSIMNEAKNLNLTCDTVEYWYKKHGEYYSLQDYRWGGRAENTRPTYLPEKIRLFSGIPFEEWKRIYSEIISVIHRSVLSMPDTAKKKMISYLRSTVEEQFYHALGK